MAEGEATVSAHALGSNSSAAGGLALICRNDCLALAQRTHFRGVLTEQEASRLALSFASEISAAASSGARARSVAEVASGNSGRIPGTRTGDDVVVESCPSTYGLTGPHPVPTSLVSKVNATDGLVFFANADMAVLAPKGWKCSGVVGADGSAQITVRPAAGSEANTAAEGSACVSCNAGMACPLSISVTFS